MPVPLVLHECPLGRCGWQHPAPAIAPGVIRTGEDTTAAMTEAALTADIAVKAHLETHTLLEWVTQVQRLREVIDLAAVSLGDHGTLGSFLKAATA